MTNKIIEAARWKPIPSYPPYEVSEFGDVRRFGKLLSQSLRKGYPRVSLSIDGKSTSKAVHTLVAEAFIGPRPPKLHVCHNDGDRANSKVCNLRYASAKENEADKALHGKKPVGNKNGMHKHPEKRAFGSKNGFAKLTEQDVKAIKAKLKIMKPWGACVKLSKEYGVSISTISLINTGKLWAQV